LKKIGILGTSHSFADAPYDDPTWEFWGTGPALAPFYPRLDRWFEVHDMEEQRGNPILNTPYLNFRGQDPRFKDYWAFLKSGEIPVYVQSPWPEVPDGIVYPLEEIKAVFGPRLESTCAWMTALAIHEGAQEIGFWGVAMNFNEEWAYQRPNMHYFIGLCAGLGIKTYVTEDLMGPEMIYGLKGWVLPKNKPPVPKQGMTRQQRRKMQSLIRRGKARKVA
jgi:hypothetical protein